MKYQRFLTPGFKPFDPLELAGETEKIVTRRGYEGFERKYTDFYSVPVYRGIATGYAAGCCLRCVYCWSNWSRDFPSAISLSVTYAKSIVIVSLMSAKFNGINSFNSIRSSGFTCASSVCQVF